MNGNNLPTPENVELPTQYAKTHGGLRVQAFTARRAFPVQGATVIISGNPESGGLILAELRTDISGLTPAIILPGIPSEYTQNPNFNMTDEFAQNTYVIEVSHPQFVPMRFERIPVYQNIVSLQNADLTAKSASETPNTTTVVNNPRLPV